MQGLVRICELHRHRVYVPQIIIFKHTPHSSRITLSSPFSCVCVCVFCDVNTEKYAYGRRKQPFDRTHILTKVNGKRASSLCLLVLNFCFQNETDTQKTTFPLMELNFFSRYGNTEYGYITSGWNR